ncbi:PEPxxWA-CTERM sorting domain-containing protein [uncultured Phenylobacterium sp.]|uniref:PEPxxWA-CTERM sorting domain-containing protein n=1 Tax=uncultured Phenylobacterium sp. TaxID=349273 RepID=UPI0025E42672|nr:PEPxxWA-CTERM sorting domain-containing protein [uncultured Phenylobacterium sp.]
MRTRLTALALAIGVTVGAPASAATVTGTFSPSGPGEVSLAMLFPTDPGVYELSFEFSRPGAGHISTHLMESYEFYYAATGEHLGGDDHLYDEDVFFPAPTSYGSTFFTIGRPYSVTTGFERTEGYFWNAKVGLRGAFSGPAQVTYSFTVDHIRDVPEPATWALMILGFGGVGIALRRRETRRLMTTAHKSGTDCSPDRVAIAPAAGPARARHGNVHTGSYGSSGASSSARRWTSPLGREPSLTAYLRARQRVGVR